MNFNHMILDIRRQLAVIILNRPEVLNALNHDLVTEIQAAVESIRKQPEIRALVITGSEKNFAAGADISNMVDFTPDEARAFSFKDCFNQVALLEIPTIAAIDGFALGGGLELALACDIRLCSPQAKLGFPEIKLGIFPGAGGTQRLPRAIGISRAKEMIYTGDIMDASTAVQIGLCSRIVENELLEEAVKLADRLSKGPTVALKLSKRAIDTGMDMDILQGIELEAEEWAKLFVTQDQKEGMKAFLAKRRANFIGK